MGRLFGTDGVRGVANLELTCELAMKLPANETPAHTEDREGFFHLTDMSGDVVSAKLSYIVRDHDKNSFESRLNKLRALEVEMNQKYGANLMSVLYGSI